MLTLDHARWHLIPLIPVMWAAPASPSRAMGTLP